MTRWALRYACELYEGFGERYPGEMPSMVRTLGLTAQEVRGWERIADKIVFLMGSDGLIEEFEGYFEKRNVAITSWDEHGMPVWPSDVELRDVSKTQLIKQADVVLLLYLLADEFSLDVKRVNFDYYEPRTTHMSSLSITSYAILAKELGKTEKAYSYLRHAANSDLANIHGNTDLGIHAAEVGGAWQIAIRGFAGVRVRDRKVRIDPSLPESWKGMRFHMWFRGNLMQISASDDAVEVFMVEGREPVEMEVWGARRVLKPGGTVRVER
jgi:kojibiose phosphorylase